MEQEDEGTKKSQDYRINRAVRGIMNNEIYDARSTEDQ